MLCTCFHETNRAQNIDLQHLYAFTTLCECGNFRHTTDSVCISPGRSVQCRRLSVSRSTVKGQSGAIWPISNCCSADGNGNVFSRGCSRGRTRYARIIDIMVVIEPPPRTDVGWIRGTSVMNAAAASSVRHKMVPESVKARPETQLDNIKIWCDTVNFPFCRSALLQ